MGAPGWVLGVPGKPQQDQLWLGWEEALVSRKLPLYSPPIENQRQVRKTIKKWESWKLLESCFAMSELMGAESLKGCFH